MSLGRLRESEAERKTQCSSTYTLQRPLIVVEELRTVQLELLNKTKK